MHGDHNTLKKLATRLGLSAFLLFTVLTLGACASAPLPPTESLTEASNAIARAEQSDARQFAGAELEEANQQMLAANKALAEEKMTQADRHAKQARIAAELAIARTEAAKAAAINREMNRGANALEEEMQRQGGSQ